MTMTQRIFLTITFILLLGAMTPSTAQADCGAADQCTKKVCNTRQANVHPACDRKRSCVGTTKKSVLTDRLKINQDCLAARTHVSACFSKGDKGHELAIEQVRNAIITCEKRLKL